ncbi:putative 29 kDa protein in mitochondrial S-1 DNA [Bienertia sinuspersici]
MSGGEVRRLSDQEVQVVKNLIERCIQLHMSRKEVVNVLSSEANVTPSITEVLWQRLEDENQEFFEVYHIRLALKEQIQRFNELLKQQAALMGKIQSAGVAPMPASNGSHMTQFQQNAGCYGIDQTGPSMRPESLQPPIAPSLPSSFTNGVSHLQTPTAFDMSAPSRTIDCLPDTLHVQSSDSIRMMHGLNGGIVKSESGYPSDSPIFYEADPHLGEAHGSMEDASVATFSGIEASSQPLNETLLGMNGSFGQLGHIPKIFSLPDLAYSNVLENYTNSAFMTTESENFLDSRERGEIPEENKVAMTESYSNYEEFGSE